MMDLLLVLGNCVAADSLMIPNIEFYQHDDELFVRLRKLVTISASITTGPHIAFTTIVFEPVYVLLSH